MATEQIHSKTLRDALVDDCSEFVECAFGTCACLVRWV
jgi:hypothetical protein